MARKSWHLDRRTFLRGSGVALALPLLDCMQTVASTSAKSELPKRMCMMYFPFGASVPADDHQDRDWGWFPVRDGDSFRYTRVMESLDPLRQQVTVLAGLSHPNGREIGGHDTGDIFLTGASFQGASFQNTVSCDQLAAHQLGEKTRFASLVLASDGGIGLPTRSQTLSYSLSGQPIPSLENPQQIFDRLFGDESGTLEQARRRLATEASMLDLVLSQSKLLRNKLGKQDQLKYDEYLNSIRETEKRVARSQQWLDIPKGKVDDESLDLSGSKDEPLVYMRTMYDLIYLAFKTDSTRIATYMLGGMDGGTANSFPKALGLGTQHDVAHGAGKPGGFQKQGLWNQCLVKNHAYFLQRLADTPEGDGNMLENTMVLMGTSNSRTHDNHNYPLVFAGGKNMGLKHDQYLDYRREGDDAPMSNLLFTMLNRLGVSEARFSDSTGDLSELYTS